MNYFQKFKAPISEIKLPEKFTFPFYYKPHPLAKIATKEVQEYLENQTDFKHNFGLSEDNTTLPIGKMFGVLVVKNSKNEIGYLTAFSGKLADKSLPDKFVPPVFNMRSYGSFYLKGEEEITEMNHQLSFLEQNENYIDLKKSLQNITKSINDDLEKEKEKLKRYKKERKARKKTGKSTLNKSDFKLLEKKLIQESFNNQFYYKELEEYYKNKVARKKKRIGCF